MQKLGNDVINLCIHVGWTRDGSHGTWGGVLGACRRGDAMLKLTAMDSPYYGAYSSSFCWTIGTDMCILCTLCQKATIPSDLWL